MLSGGMGRKFLQAVKDNRCVDVIGSSRAAQVGMYTHNQTPLVLLKLNTKLWWASVVLTQDLPCFRLQVSKSLPL